MQPETAPLFVSIGFEGLFYYFVGKTSAVGEDKPSAHKKKLLQLVGNEAAFPFSSNALAFGLKRRSVLFETSLRFPSNA